MMQGRLSGFMDIDHFWGLAKQAIDTHVSLIMGIILGTSHLVLLANRKIS